jgi:hypothetical protein
LTLIASAFRHSILFGAFSICLFASDQFCALRIQFRGRVSQGGASAFQPVSTSATVKLLKQNQVAKRFETKWSADLEICDLPLSQTYDVSITGYRIAPLLYKGIRNRFPNEQKLLVPVDTEITQDLSSPSSLFYRFRIVNDQDVVISLAKVSVIRKGVETTEESCQTNSVGLCQIEIVIGNDGIRKNSFIISAQGYHPGRLIEVEPGDFELNLIELK